MEAKRPFSQLDWLSTPEPVRAYIIHLADAINAYFKDQTPDLRWIISDY